MNQVRVRMYRPGGIGDCFLLSFPKSEGFTHMLIDCGVLRGTEQGQARMQTLVDNIAEATNGRLDVLVVTHEHWDHVSGFLQAQEQFARLKIGEVWLAWTEKPDDEQAQLLRKHKVKAMKAVQDARQKLAAVQDHAIGVSREQAMAAKDMVGSLAGLGQFFGDFGAAGRQSTAEAMTWARERTGARVRWLEPGEEPFGLAGVEGVRTYVLGPPRDEALLKRSDPSKQNSEVYATARGMYLGFAAAFGEAKNGESAQPFDKSFVRSTAGEPEDSFFVRHYLASEEWRKIELDWLSAAEWLALRLDSDTNNTSLALAFELTGSGRVLLFPGDAQVGNWLSWSSLEWTVKDSKGRPMKVADLLRRTVLYKVGHHASHNATLREQGLALMTDPDLVAMITVDHEQAKQQGKDGWDMPYPALLAELEKKTAGRILRTDLGAPDAVRSGNGGRCVQTADYIDYMVDL